MLARLAARLLTGPLAFLVAGVLDVSTLWTRWAIFRLRERARERRSRLAAR